MHLEVNNLGYRVDGHYPISNVSFTSQAETCTAVLGPNGSGKTLLLRLCHGLLLPTEGSVLWDGKVPKDVFNKITMVFQHPVLLSRSAQKNIEHVLSLRGVAKSKRKKQARHALQLVGLLNHADTRATYMSGGQRQRLSIARALVLKPSVILMDEPTASIDMESVVKIEELISHLVADGVKVILTSHNPAQVKRLCNEVIFLDEGHVVCHASKQDFFSRVDNQKVRLFIASQTL